MYRNIVIECAKSIILVVLLRGFGEKNGIESLTALTMCLEEWLSWVWGHTPLSSLVTDDDFDWSAQTIVIATGVTPGPA